jgi:hypothetical protein
MSRLTDSEKLQLILDTAKEYNITPYEFGTHTSISVYAARSVLKGNTKKPAGKTIEAMYQYITKKTQGAGTETVEQPPTESHRIEELIARRVEERITPMLEKLSQDMKYLIMRERVYRMDVNALEENIKELRDVILDKK